MIVKGKIFPQVITGVVQNSPVQNIGGFDRIIFVDSLPLVGIQNILYVNITDLTQYFWDGTEWVIMQGGVIEMRIENNFIQWRLTPGTWVNLISLDLLKGADGQDGVNGTNGTNGTNGVDGKQVELQSANNIIQWRYVGDTVWINLIDLSGFITAETDPIFQAWLELNPNVRQHTHAELLSLCTANELKIGDLYLLTDYETTYTQPVTNISMSSGVIEPLLLKASSTNTFETICSSALYPRDIISYDINDSLEGFTKGKIFRRNDTINSIDAGTDWRHVKYRRWKLYVTTEWVQGQNYTIGDIVTTGYDIYICTKTHIDSLAGDIDTNFYHYPFSNGDFASLYSTGQPIYIGSVEYIIPVSANFEDRLKFGNGCIHHKWDGNTLDNMVIGDGNNFWTVGHGNNSWTVGNDNSNWSIGLGNGYWVVGGDNSSWIIKFGNYYWSIGFSNLYWDISNSNGYWIIGNSFFNYGVKNDASNITPPNISADYLKTIYKAGTKQLLEYTDEFGDVNIIDL